MITVGRMIEEGSLDAPSPHEKQKSAFSAGDLRMLALESEIAEIDSDSERRRD